MEGGQRRGGGGAARARLKYRALFLAGKVRTWYIFWQRIGRIGRFLRGEKVFWRRKMYYLLVGIKSIGFRFPFEAFAWRVDSAGGGCWELRRVGRPACASTITCRRRFRCRRSKNSRVRFCFLIFASYTPLCFVHCCFWLFFIGLHNVKCFVFFFFCQIRQTVSVGSDRNSRTAGQATAARVVLR